MTQCALPLVVELHAGRLIKQAINMCRTPEPKVKRCREQVSCEPTKFLYLKQDHAMDYAITGMTPTSCDNLTRVCMRSLFGADHAVSLLAH